MKFLKIRTYISDLSNFEGIKKTSILKK